MEQDQPNRSGLSPLLSSGGAACIKPFTVPSRPCTHVAGLSNSSSPGVKIPLKGIELKVNIVDSLAEVNLTQTFVNSEDQPIECLYQIPTDDKYAVTGITAMIGDKVMKTEIMEKGAAEAKYDDAVASGNTAFKGSYDEKLPDVINLALG